MTRTLRRTLFTLVAVVLVGAALEGLARAALRLGAHAYLPPEVARWVETHEVVFDPELGWRPAIAFEDIRGAAFLPQVAANPAPYTPAGMLRGYALGDSQTHGAGLAEGRAWPEVTQRVLRDAGYSVGLTNLGSPGYRSAQVLRLLELYVAPLRPDFVVVDCIANDSPPLPTSANVRAVESRRALFDSRLYRLLWLGVAAARGQNLGAYGDVRIQQPEWAGTKGAGNHAAIAALGAKNGFKVIFVDYPFMASPATSLANATLLPPGVPVVAATEALVASGASAQELFFENNHLSVRGAEIVGDEVAKVLVGTLDLGPPPTGVPRR